ncbi:hypothetical protein F5Y08DRAFT_124953 [Xylaria arbuscula]|nr:hypothetical protein F5Y08DRAFT_124953 [Xylaria arbuscula]
MDAAGLAITLSGTVLKLVIFSLDFISDVKQVHKHGATDRNVDLSAVAESVALVTTSLENQLAAANDNALGEGPELDVDDVRLKSLSIRAAEIGRELAQKLCKVTTDKKSTWKSFKAAASGMWDADDIEKTEKRLNAIKDEIQFNILVGIRDKVNQTNDDGNSRILAALEEVAGKQARSKDDSAHMIEILNNADRIGQGRHDELVQLGNHLLHAIRALSNPASPTHTPLPQPSTYLHDDSAREAAENMVLVSVWYPSKHDREETIDKAHANTFQWIFEDPKATGNQWSSFVDFLQGGTPSYWITGKPGSGKSTLMKYISQTPKTQDYLRQWAGEKPLIQASHYFYYGGSDNEKTEIGLFKSLLHSILDKRRDLIPIAFKDRFQTALEGKKHEDPSLPEAKRALMDLLRQCSDTKFIFSLDGLDEFDPIVSRTHVHSLLEFTHFLEKCENVKTLVSSRPLPEFERSYDGRPFLKVQDLTRGDIRRFAYERLEDHPRMKILEKEDPESINGLLESIVESSVGVFLWVRVVIESLVEGLTNHDSIDDLRKLLQELPSDLHALYSTILQRIKPSYKPKAARLLCIVHHAQRNGQVLSLLDLWFADNADDAMVYNTSVESMSDENFPERINGLETRFKSQCLGLIETVPMPDTNRSSPGLRYSAVSGNLVCARFLHRSVYEFLNRSDVWSGVVEQYLYRFSAALSLFRSIILLIKTYRLYGTAHREIMDLAFCAGDRARNAERETEQAHCRLVQELDLAMSGLMPLAYLAPDVTEDPSLVRTSSAYRKHHWWGWCRHRHSYARDSTKIYRPLHDREYGSLMAFAAENSLSFYVRSQISEKGRDVLRKKGLPLLGYAMMPFAGPGSSSWNEMLMLLLDEGSDPNEIYNGTSLWQWHLWTMYAFNNTYEGGGLSTWISIYHVKALETLLLRGVDPNAYIMHLSTMNLQRRVMDLELPWAPVNLKFDTSSVRTILLELRRESQSFKDNIVDKWSSNSEYVKNIHETMLKMITFLEDQGALEKEWENIEDMKQIFLDVYRRMTDKSWLGENGVLELEGMNMTGPTPDVPSGTTMSETANAPKLLVESGVDYEPTTLTVERERRQAEPISSSPTKTAEKGWRKRADRMIRKIRAQFTAYKKGVGAGSSNS